MKTIIYCLLLVPTFAFAQSEKEMLKVYRAMQEGARKIKTFGELYESIAADRPAGDQAYIKTHMKELATQAMPTLNYSPKGVDWTMDGKKYLLQMISPRDGLYRLNDREIKMDWKKSISQMEKVITEQMKTAGLWNLIVPEAHAVLPPGLAFYGMIYFGTKQFEEFVGPVEGCSKAVENFMKFAKKPPGTDGMTIVFRPEIDAIDIGVPPGNLPYVRVTKSPESTKIIFECYRENTDADSDNGNKVTYKHSSAEVKANWVNHKLSGITAENITIYHKKRNDQVDNSPEPSEKGDAVRCFYETTRAHSIMTKYYEQSLKHCEAQIEAFGQTAEGKAMLKTVPGATAE